MIKTRLNKFTDEKNMDIVCIKGKPYLFLNYRIDRDTIPDDMFAYDVMDNEDDGMFHYVTDHASIDHWGTVIGLDRIVEAENGGAYTCCEPDGCFISHMYSDEEYRNYYRQLLCETEALAVEADEERTRYSEMSDKELLTCFFGILENGRKDNIHSGMISFMIMNSIIIEEVRKRTAAGEAKDAFESYISSVCEYLNEREKVFENGGEENPEFLNGVRESEKELISVFE